MLLSSAGSSRNWPAIVHSWWCVLYFPAKEVSECESRTGCCAHVKLDYPPPPPPPALIVRFTEASKTLPPLSLPCPNVETSERGGKITANIGTRALSFPNTNDVRTHRCLREQRKALPRHQIQQRRAYSKKGVCVHALCLSALFGDVRTKRLGGGDVVCEISFSGVPHQLPVHSPVGLVRRGAENRPPGHATTAVPTGISSRSRPGRWLSGKLAGTDLGCATSRCSRAPGSF